MTKLTELGLLPVEKMGKNLERELLGNNHFGVNQKAPSKVKGACVNR